MANELYTVTVLGWEKHNGKKKKGHANIMLSTRFFDDEKICALGLYARLVYVWLLLRCGSEAHGTCSFQARQVLVGGRFRARKVRDACSQLQELQLVRIDKFPSLKTLQDKTLQEEKRQEENIRPSEQQTLLLAEPAGPPVLHPFAILWNENCGTLPKVKSCEGKRGKLIRAIWPNRSPAQWAETIKRMVASDFCKGSSGWVATFDWLLKPGNSIKVDEGNYDNGRGFKKTAQTAKYDNLDALEQEWAARGAGK